MESSFGMHFVLWGVSWEAFLVLFSGMNKAWSLIEHGCDLHSLKIRFKVGIGGR